MLQAITIPNPSFYGLAKERQSVALEPQWATEAQNCVVDGAGRLAARKGWVLQNTALAGNPTLVQLHEYLTVAGVSTIISTTATKIYSGVTGTLTDISPTGAPTAGNWQFVNFNGKVLGWQASHTPIVWSGSSVFATITAASGTLPDGNCALAAFGRIWAVDDDKQTIRYCALLDETRWATADGGGSIDMRSVWTKGTDEVVRIVAYGSSLIVFGKRHIVIWTDGAGSELGLSPTNIYVAQVIENIGLVARDALAVVGEIDVVFWSPQGVRTLSRTIQEQASPVVEVSPSNRQFHADAISVGDLTKIRAVYSPTEALVLFSHPDAAVTYCFDLRGRTPDNGLRETTWTVYPTSMLNTVGNKLYFGFDGRIGLYSGFDDNDVAYRFKWRSGWILLPPEERNKLLKRWKVVVASTASYNVSLSHWTDFQANIRNEQIAVEAEGDEWNVDEWSLMEWSGGRSVHELFPWLSRECQHVKLGIDVDIDGGAFAIQSMTLYYRPTNLA